MPPITETQIQMLRALLAKKGWSEAYFGWKAKVTLTDLTTSQARSWIARLTKETKGKPRPTTLLEPPSAPMTDEPRRKDSANAPACQ